MGYRPYDRYSAPSSIYSNVTMQYTRLAREHLRVLVEQEPKREELRDLA